MKPKKVKANPNIFRPGTMLEQQRVVFIFVNGGLGDYINFMSAVIWAAEQNPHVVGHVLVTEPFRTVAAHILKDYPNWTAHVHGYLRTIQDTYDRVLVHYPRREHMLISATGAHLMDLGFMWFAQMSKPPKDYGFLPEINYNEPWKWPALKERPYAVFTPGATAKSRVIYPRYFNELVNYTVSKGITPVFLGKRDFADGNKDIAYNATIQDGYDFSKGIDLTEKTTLLEATQIMSKACFVLGLDNGLLHFAGTTTTPIIFGHNVASVEQRDIRRRSGQTINVHLEESGLSCIACQSKMRYMVGHKFSDCFYRSHPSNGYKCLELLFSEGCATWKMAIDHMLNLPRISSRIASYDMNETDLPSP
jgi:ADP-heptose:LPS heptosyltransferase